MCKKLSLKLKAGLRLKVFKHMVLNKIFGHKRKEMTEDRRKLRNQWLCDLYSH